MSKINVSVDCVIFGFDNAEKKLKVLTIEKKVNPFSNQKQKKTQFAIPGDLIEINEDIDDAANRVLFSLTKLKNLYLKQFKTFGNPSRVQQKKDKEWLENFRANPNERVITIGYISLVNIQKFKPKASSFAQDVIWVPVKDIPELTFDHNDIVNSALKFLKNELNHEMSSFLLPKDFTIPQLQKLYEDVLNKKFDSRNFRKHFLRKGVLIKTKNKNKTGRTGKPARFYQFDENEKNDS